MKNLLFLLFAAMGMIAHSQVAINTDGSLPDNSAMLDIKSTVKGMLLPRMTMAQRNAITSPASGLMIYQTDNTPGCYFNSGNSNSPAWVIAGTGSGWGLTGNAGTNPASNFIGTTDNQPLLFRVNNTWSGEINPLTGNLFLGLSTGISNTTGHSNIALGSGALYTNTSGYSNSATGYQALFTNNTGERNTANGYCALYSNTNGRYNTAIGFESLKTNGNGWYNTAVGYQALYTNIGSYNTAYGNKALFSNTYGEDNTATGLESLFSNTTGSENTANGSQSLLSNTEGIENTAIGFKSLYTNITGSYNTASGYAALYTNLTGDRNTAIGFGALLTNSTGFSNTSTGFGSLYFNTDGRYNTADGFESLNSNTIGTFNTATGRQSLFSNTEGQSNSANGSQALYLNTTGSWNTAIGIAALYYNSTGYLNTAIGCGAGTDLLDLVNTTSLGNGATATGNDMVRIGDTYVSSIGGFTDWTNISDERFKENIREDVPGLSFITQLRPVTYQLNREKINEFTGVNDRRNQIKEQQPGTEFQSGDKYSPVTTGFLAQEVETAAKCIGFDFSGVDAPKNENDMYGLRYAEFVVPLVKAVQELNQKNETLENFVKTQQEAIDIMKKQNEQLVQRIEKLEAK
jgi:hypothetical protein